MLNLSWDSTEVSLRLERRSKNRDSIVVVDSVATLLLIWLDLQTEIISKKTKKQKVLRFNILDGGGNNFCNKGLAQR